MTEDTTGNHAAGNPGEDPHSEDLEPRYLTKGGDAEERAKDPFDDESVRWSPETNEGPES